MCNNPVNLQYISLVLVFYSCLSSAPSTTTTSADCPWPVSTTCQSYGPCKWHSRVLATHCCPEGKDSSHPCLFVQLIDRSVLVPSPPPTALLLPPHSQIYYFSSPSPHLFSSLVCPPPPSPLLSPLLFPSLPPPLSLSRLHSNNLQCDCHVAWLSEWLRQRPRLGLYTQCMAPPHLRGHNVAEVQKKEFVCTGRPIGVMCGVCVQDYLFRSLSLFFFLLTSTCCLTVANPFFALSRLLFLTVFCSCFSRWGRRQVFMFHCLALLQHHALHLQEYVVIHFF